MSRYVWFCGCGTQGNGESNAIEHGKTCSLMGRPNTAELPRFWARVDKKTADECWPWLGSLEPQGYPVFHLTGGKKERGHRYALRLKLGRSIETGKIACHSCHNRACVNPAHLYEGTDKTNSDDKLAAGRHAFGSKHGTAHLADAAVAEIVRRYRSGGVLQKDLAAEYGICRSQVSLMVRGKAWQHVTNPAWPRPDGDAV